MATVFGTTTELVNNQELFLPSAYHLSKNPNNLESEDSFYAGPITSGVFDGVPKEDGQGHLMADYLTSQCKEISQAIRTMVRNGNIVNPNQVESYLTRWVSNLESSYPLLMTSWLNNYKKMLKDHGVSGADFLRKVQIFEKTPPQATGVLAIGYYIGDRKLVTLLHKGDCRAYRLRNGRLEKLTLDHLKVFDSIPRDVRDAYLDKFDSLDFDLNELSKLDDLRRNSILFDMFKNKGAISSAFGIAGTPVTISTYDVNPGDIIILTTNGVHHNLTTREIEELANEYTHPEALSKAIVEKAHKRSNEKRLRSEVDDKTCVVLTSRLELKNFKPYQSEKYPFKLGDWVTLYLTDLLFSHGWIIESINPEGTFNLLRLSDNVRLPSISGEKLYIPCYLGDIVIAEFGSNLFGVNWSVISINADGSYTVKNPDGSRTQKVFPNKVRKVADSSINQSSEKAVNPHRELQIGDSVKVTFNDGQVQDGWKVVEKNVGGYYKVQKIVNNHVYSIDVHKNFITSSK